MSFLRSSSVSLPVCHTRKHTPYSSFSEGPFGALLPSLAGGHLVSSQLRPQRAEAQQVGAPCVQGLGTGWRLGLSLVSSSQQQVPVGTG